MMVLEGKWAGPQVIWFLLRNNTDNFGLYNSVLFISQTTLDGVDMEDDMKTLVSDEIKKFRKSYQVGVSIQPIPF